MANVFVIQDIPGTKMGAPKINIIGATEFGDLKVLLPEKLTDHFEPNICNTDIKTKIKRLSTR